MQRTFCLVLLTIAWLISSCGTVEVADGTGGVCEPRCVGANQPVICVNGEEEVLESCPDGLTCSAGDCVAVTPDSTGDQPDATTTTPDSTDPGPEDVTTPPDEETTACVPACDGKVCGDDGCEGDCGACTGVAECSDEGQCECAPEVALVCNDDGTAVISAEGCPDAGEPQATCDHGCTDGVCNVCAADCGDKVCGDDGCGGSCGECIGVATCSEDGLCTCAAEDELVCNEDATAVVVAEGCPEPVDARPTCAHGCVDGACCVPDCEGKACGADGCGGICDVCTGVATCTEATGQCDCASEVASICNAEGTEVIVAEGCPQDGETLATCGFGCAEGACLNCTDECGDKECGTDACGVPCGPGCTGVASCSDEGQCVCAEADTLVCNEAGTVVVINAGCPEAGTEQETCDYGCTDGACDACVPQCDGKECGPSGCDGGDCGLCTGVAQCGDDGQCICAVEVASVCNGDSTAVIGAEGCPQDGETLASCDYGCTDGSCDPCVPDCTGKACGGDGCGGSCGTCTGVAACDGNGQCQCSPDVDSVCNGDDTAVIGAEGCPQDGVTLATCNFGCTNGACDGCSPACDGLECGGDGCGDSCGSCQSGAICVEGLCDCGAYTEQVCIGDDIYMVNACNEQGDLVTNCASGCSEGECTSCWPLCAENECGPDGCGGSCGDCEVGAICDEGQCECQPTDNTTCAIGSVFAVDSCGNPTGLPLESCQYECSEGACQPCTPSCDVLSCGSDGCDGMCTCEDGMICNTFLGSNTCGMCWQDDDCADGLVCVMSEPTFCAECAGDSDCKGLNKACVNYSCSSLETPTLVINEIDYDTSGTDIAEFVELYNAGNAAISTLQMTNVYLYFIDATLGLNYEIVESISLAELLDSPLQPGEYAVVANASVILGLSLSVPSMMIPSNTLPNGTFGASAVVLALEAPGDSFATPIDSVHYEGDITAVEGFDAWAAEGDPASADTGNKGLSRCANGTDTGNNSADFALKTITPGQANSCGTSNPGDPKD